MSERMSIKTRQVAPSRDRIALRGLRPSWSLASEPENKGGVESPELPVPGGLIFRPPAGRFFFVADVTSTPKRPLMRCSVLGSLGLLAFAPLLWAEQPKTDKPNTPTPEAEYQALVKEY